MCLYLKYYFKETNKKTDENFMKHHLKIIIGAVIAAAIILAIEPMLVIAYMLPLSLVIFLDITLVSKIKIKEITEHSLRIRLNTLKRKTKILSVQMLPESFNTQISKLLSLIEEQLNSNDYLKESEINNLGDFYNVLDNNVYKLRRNNQKDYNTSSNNANVGSIDVRRAFNYFNINSNVSFTVVKSTYKKLAMKHHPDKGGNPSKFQEINNFYNILKKHYQCA